MERLRVMGIEQAFVTLHVGLDTFRPVQADDPANHIIHTERWEVSQSTADAVNRAKFDGRRVVAVGTTSVRVLETAARAASGMDAVAAGIGETGLFILPGFSFQAVDAMVTNFHLPRSTLLMLVSAFVGREAILNAYREAIRERYRFFSFGDGMFIA
jgi:S-adenosylmethionine:tRNA ribosyltransferase-isomerase